MKANRKPKLHTPVVLQPPKSREERIADAMEEINHRIDYHIKRAQEEIAEFSAKLVKDAAYQMEWSKGIFVEAARERIAKTVRAMIDNAKQNNDEYVAMSDYHIIVAVREELQHEVLRNARWPEHSTSPTSNYMSLCLMSERAEWLEKLNNHIAHIDRAVS